MQSQSKISLVIGIGVLVGISSLIGYHDYNVGESARTTCVIIPEGNLILTIENSSNQKPISSLPIHITFLAPRCSPNPYTTSSLATMATNGSGVLTICCNVGEYYFSVTLSGATYNTNASIGAEKATCVIWDIPSGKVSITFSQTFQTSC
jgi:hypothetical protein